MTWRCPGCGGLVQRNRWSCPRCGISYLEARAVHAAIALSLVFLAVMYLWWTSTMVTLPLGYTSTTVGVLPW